ncbi:MAG: hypothetical protein D4R82_05905 [Dehalococcoidia bacterium]|nr:MAG: hypothetical protein D4R82_05905 [Dehalococcoidia bacterium]
MLPSAKLRASGTEIPVAHSSSGHVNHRSSSAFDVKRQAEETSTPTKPPSQPDSTAAYHRKASVTPTLYLMPHGADPPARQVNGNPTSQADAPLDICQTQEVGESHLASRGTARHRPKSGNDLSTADHSKVAPAASLPCDLHARQVKHEP